MNQRIIPYIAIASACCTCFFAAPAVAWNSPGHMIVALIADGQMNDATRAKVNELLRAHPRFEAHFERLMPREVSNADEADKAQWIFAHSGTWPDLVRDTSATVDREDVNRFNRPFWHYINQPVFLNDAEGRKLEPHLRLYGGREPPPDHDDPNMNIIQAFKNSSRVVGDASAPAQNRAVHLCWLVHLAGDSHQPLHAASLYTSNRFRRGDRGGNDLEIEHEWKLHAFWDSQVCTQDSFETLQRLAANVIKNEEKAAAGRKAAESIDIETWIDESNDYAKRFAYTEEVLQKVAAREEHIHLGPLDLSPAYRIEAETLSERRAIEAGFRLTKHLEILLNTQ
ncbi:MAG: S1/P1 nuclease [Planctomycetes bacterium]|nr:S1/P1 nuclease [Planctomycetota bacterium]